MDVSGIWDPANYPKNGRPWTPVDVGGHCPNQVADLEVARSSRAGRAIDFVAVSIAGASRLPFRVAETACGREKPQTSGTGPFSDSTPVLGSAIRSQACRYTARDLLQGGTR